MIHQSFVSQKLINTSPRKVTNRDVARYGTWTHDPQIKSLPTELTGLLTILSMVVPIVASGDRTSARNYLYRPITILPILSNIIEKTVHRQLYTHFKENNLLAPEVVLTHLTENISWIIMMLWFSFILGSHSISVCFQTNYHNYHNPQNKGKQNLNQG